MKDYISQEDYDLMDHDINREGLTVLQALKAEIDKEVQDFMLNVPPDMQNNPRFMFILDSMQKIMIQISDIITDKYMPIEKEDLVNAYSTGWHDGQYLMWDKVRNIEYNYLGGDDGGYKYYVETYKKA